MRMALSLKDIHDTLNSLRMEGRNINELEGLLIHTDDLEELLQSIPEHHNGMSHDGIKLLGVKIIESRYAQKGTIFRIFKTNDKLYAPDTDFGPIVRGSGVVHIPDDMRLPTMADSKRKEKKKKKRRHSKARKIELD